jgi:hypothetical protein
VTGRFDPRGAARAFWARAGAEEPFPRRLTPTIAAILPVAVVFLPRLTVRAITEYLNRRGAGCFRAPERPLRGCLVAQRGHAFIFVDGGLAEDEQRITIAHETAHFVHHYDEPRLTALAHYGESIREVLDGDRSATPAERLLGALRCVPIGVYEHAMERGDDSRPDERTSALETEADLLAFELLAPARLLLRDTVAGDECRRALVDHYGLPPWAAAAWGRWIDSHRRTDSFIEHLQNASRKNPV